MAERIIFKQVDEGREYVGVSECGSDERALEEYQHKFEGGERVLVVTAGIVKPSAVEYTINKTFEVNPIN